MSIPGIMERLRTRKSKSTAAKPAPPQPPEGEQLEAAHALIAAVSRYSAERRDAVASQAAVDDLAGKVAAAIDRLEKVDEHGDDFIFKNYTDLGDIRTPGVRVRYETVKSRIEGEIESAEQALVCARNELTLSDITLSAAIRDVVQRLDDVPFAEQLLAAHAFRAGRALEEAEATRVAADRGLHAACTAEAEAAPRSRTLGSILRSDTPSTSPKVVLARESLKEAVKAKEIASGEVARIERETRLLSQVVASAVVHERAMLEQENERRARR